jgi:hypothetical protein
VIAHLADFIVYLGEMIPLRARDNGPGWGRFQTGVFTISCLCSRNHLLRPVVPLEFIELGRLTQSVCPDRAPSPLKARRMTTQHSTGKNAVRTVGVPYAENPLYPPAGTVHGMYILGTVPPRRRQFQAVPPDPGAGVSCARAQSVSPREV